MRSFSFFKKSLLLCSFLMLFSCHKEIIICLSSSPEAAFLVEKFNVSQSKYKMTFNYATDSRKILDQEIFPDLIIDWNIQDTSLHIDYQTLSPTLINAKDLYPGLLEMGKIRNKQRLLPLAFNLPLVAYAHTAGEDEYPKTQSLDQIAENANKFSQKNRYEYTRMGYSPIWEPDSLFLTYRIFGLEFVPMNKGFYADGVSLQNSQIKMDDWIKQTIPDKELERQFRDKYLHYPGYTLLDRKLLCFYYYNSSDFFNIYPQNLSKLSLSWISSENKIPALEEVLFAAIPVKAHSPKGAEAFLKWITNPKNQKTLIQEKNQLGLDSFGLLNGFSSNIKINESIYPESYPLLRDRIPNQNEIAFPRQLPYQLIKAKSEIIVPWMQAKVLGEADWNLEIQIDRWLRLQPISR